MAPVDRNDSSYKRRHSTAHVLAQAVKEMFPEAKLAWGPPHDRFENGFYYDFDLPRALTPEDLPEVEERMRRIIRDDHPFRYRVVGAEEARELFEDQPYKLETIDDLTEGKDEYGEARSGSVVISTYRQDTFEDLCLGPHLENTGQIPVEGFKLLDVSGAYWRGSEKNKMLQRVHGTVWPSKEDLESYLWRREEEERRDHRRLGAELDLFSIRPEVGPGLALFHPKGALVRVLMEDYWRERHRAGGYDFVATPHVGRSVLWETSGHLRWYEEGMYSSITVENERYYLKPMNCPFHMLIFNGRPRSYRDLPLRFAELGTVYRYEPSGTLRGLLRVRGFTQDDAHLFCRPDQRWAEIDRVLEFCLSFLAAFGFEEPKMELSVRDPQTPEKYAGSEADWEMAESTLAAALEARGLPYERVEGEAVFYGPKIDIGILDALGRRWQASTIQFDFNLPERFDLTYVGEDNRPHRPYMVHRALYGSIERFFALLIEHHAGALPVWLAPTQAVVVPVAERNLDYARKVGDELAAAGFRAEVDERQERMNAKIRDAQLQKIPYMLVVGNREEEARGVSVRLRTNENRGMTALSGFVDHLREVVGAKGGM
ncbi:MAG: threonine--tRNA ligase [Actinobacteria bacterium]|nr:threonine--tRNA ligase [Actinomycetota bacterium]MCA1739894.1 threonine--tRNA ligase [Actinomycetota bacterium]